LSSSECQFAGVTADVGVELEETIQKSWPDNIVKFVRSTERLGLIRARLSGADAASGDVLVFLDAHCEVNIVWYYSSVDVSKRFLIIFRQLLCSELTFGVDLSVCMQGDHSPGKPGKVREFQSGQGKVRENGKSQGKVRGSEIC